MTNNTSFQKCRMPSFVVLATITLMLLSGCSGKSVEHGFRFDAASNPNIQILAYYYGDSMHPGARSESERYGGQTAQSAGVYGSMRRGDELYVKWKIKSTGEIHEDTVDLKRLLKGWNIRGHRIYFIVAGSQLHVYLISPERWKINPCPSFETARELYHSGDPDKKIFAKYCGWEINAIHPIKGTIKPGGKLGPPQ